MNIPAKLNQADPLSIQKVNEIIDYLAQLQLIPPPGWTASPGSNGTYLAPPENVRAAEVAKCFKPTLVPEDTAKIVIGKGYGQYADHNPVSIGPSTFDALPGLQVYVTCVYETNTWAMAASVSGVPTPSWTQGVWIVAEITATEILWRRQSDIQVPFTIREMKVCQYGIVKTINILSSVPA